MNTIFDIFLWLHITGGSIGLLTGLVNILRFKGDLVHKQIGRLFFIAMLMTGFSSLVLASIHTSYFLWMVGVFTLYMVFSGKRYLMHKNQYQRHEMLADWTISILMLIAGVVFLGMGVFALVSANSFGWVFVVFGTLGLLFVRRDFNHYRNKSTSKNQWLMGHLQRMVGSFIAALTAFLVVNAEHFPDRIPSFVYWLIPTFLLTPLIVFWSRKYGKLE